MKIFSIAEFTAKRRTEQEALADRLLPATEASLAALRDGLELWATTLLEEVAQAYSDEYRSQGGEGSPLGGRSVFLSTIEQALEKTTEDSSASRIASWLANALLNAATSAAAASDEEFLVMEWVTMHDSEVRSTHRDVEGQQRPPGEPFTVGGEELLYPGQPVGDPSIWIECRCVLAPALPENDFTMKAGVDMDDDTTEVAPQIQWHGVLAPEGAWSGDGRRFAENSLRFRDLPLPLTWQKVSNDGHKGSVTVARIDRIERVDGQMRATGVWLASAEADEVVGLIAEFGKFGVSVDADDAEMEFNEDTGEVTFTSARIASASIVAIPAFAEAYVALGPAPDGFLSEGSEEGEVLAASAFKRGTGWITNPEDTKRIHDYWTKPGQEGFVKIAWGDPGDFNRCRVLVGEKIAENSPEDLRYLNQICAQWHHDALGIWPGEHKASSEALGEAASEGVGLTLVASAGHAAPSEWFVNPNLDGPTHLTVTEEGRVFGHIAQWGVCHGAYKTCVTAPHSESNYAHYATGQVLLDNGSMVNTGVITAGGGHAPHSLSARAAAAHYDQTSMAVADVAVGEDEWGIWCAGWIRPGATPEQVTALRASDVSGDWRLVGGNLEMIAALAVNSAGFQIPRVAASISNGVQLSLVAAGIVTEEPRAEFDLDALAEKVAMAMEARASRRERVAALAARVERND